MPDSSIGMIPVNNISRLRFQILFYAALLFQCLQSVAMPTIISAAEQEMPRRHSLTHRPDVESAMLPATIQGTILKPGSAEPTRITSPIEPPKHAVSPPPTLFTHHRTLAKRRASASTTSPAASSPALPAALTSGVAARQVEKTTADTAKNTSLATTPITKSAVASPPGLTSTDSAAVASTAPSPIVGTTSVRSAVSAGSGSAASSSGSRSALSLLQNSAIASLLQPSAPVASTPPSLPPSSTPQSTPPLPNPSTGNVILTWTANEEPNVGYKIYVGTASGTYSFPGSPFDARTVTSYTVSNLPKGQTYFFAVSAYDGAGDESALSTEVSKRLF